jgi:hypothetical protein
VVLKAEKGGRSGIGSIDTVNDNTFVMLEEQSWKGWLVVEENVRWELTLQSVVDIDG